MRLLALDCENSSFLLNAICCLANSFVAHCAWGREIVTHVLGYVMETVFANEVKLSAWARLTAQNEDDFVIGFANGREKDCECANALGKGNEMAWFSAYTYSARCLQFVLFPARKLLLLVDICKVVRSTQGS